MPKRFLMMTPVKNYNQILKESCDSIEGPALCSGDCFVGSRNKLCSTGAPSRKVAPLTREGDKRGFWGRDL